MSGMGPWAERDLYENQKKAPVKIVLSPGTRLLVTLEASDGDFEILYNYEGDNKLRVLASFPDSTGRGGSEDLTSKDGQKFNPEIYCENFGDDVCDARREELSQESQDEEMLLAHEKQVIMNNIFPTKPPQIACSTAGCPRPGIIEGSKKPFMWCQECAADIAEYNREQEHLHRWNEEDDELS